MGLLDWFKKKQNVPKVDIDTFPELVLLFPEGKAEMGAEILRIQDKVHSPINEFSPVLVFIVRDLFFDKTLAEFILAVELHSVVLLDVVDERIALAHAADESQIAHVAPRADVVGEDVLGSLVAL